MKYWKKREEFIKADATGEEGPEDVFKQKRVMERPDSRIPINPEKVEIKLHLGPMKNKKGKESFTSTHL